MQIFVDADACPVVAIVEKVAKMYAVPVTHCCAIQITYYHLVTAKLLLSEPERMRWIIS